MSRCKVCSSDNLKIVYEGPIREGGSNSKFIEGFKIFKCPECGLECLDPIPENISNFYESKEYWATRFKEREKVNIDKLYNKLQDEQTRWFSEIGIDKVRNKIVADFGAGAGIFLNIVKSFASKTIGIEPSENLKKIIESNGHLHYNYSSEVKANSIDLAVSFDTLEHLENPKIFVSDIYKGLKKDGILYLGVPNQQDFLKQLIPEYLSFFYHKSHLFYYNQVALELLLKNTGFKIIKIKYIHKYDIMNMVYWAKDKQGKGKTGSQIFDEFTEMAFCSNIERQGISSHILINACK